jgi:hypothetical protein
MLMMKRAHSARPLPIPKCSCAVGTTLPAPPSAIPLLYSNVVWGKSMAVSTVVSTSMEAPLRRRSTLENEITAVLLVGITPLI